MRTTKLPSAARLALVVVMHRETIGQRIAARREDLGLSQEQLAERIGVRAQTVSRWERGTNLGRINNLDRVTEALEISMGDLMADLENPGNGGESAADSDTERLSRIEDKLDRALALLTRLADADDLEALEELEDDAGPPGSRNDRPGEEDDPEDGETGTEP